MSELLVPLLMSVAAACLAAALMGRWRRDEARGVRLMAGAGAALGGIALVLLATRNLT